MVERIEYPDGTIVYKNENGELHRADGPALIYPNGSKYWWLDGKRHREDGPAIILPNGRKEWYKNGLNHRENGPAVIRPDGTELWYNDGKSYSFKQWIKVINITDEEKMELILYYG